MPYFTEEETTELFTFFVKYDLHYKKILNSRSPEKEDIKYEVYSQINLMVSHCVSI